MSNFENLVYTSIKDNNLELTKELLMHSDTQLLNSPEYYFLNACFYLRKENLTNSWLWLWRGLEKYHDNRKLVYLMWKVNYLLNRIDAANYFEETYKSLSLGLVTDPNLPFKIENLTKAKKNNRFSVMQGSMEVANQMATLSNGLIKQGIASHTLNYYPYYLNYDSDYEWSLIGKHSNPILNAKLRKLTYELLPFYDLFHFHWGTTLTFDYSDLPMYKEFDKKVIMQHWGSDVRLYSEAKKLNPYALVKNRNEDQIKWRLQTLSKHVNDCIVFDMELFHYVKEYYEHITVIPAMVNLESYKPIENENRNNKIIIAHAPTSPYIKGTKYILEAIEKLKGQYNFEFILVQGKSHREAIKIYQEADLIIDQLHVGSYGLFAVETMAMGKPVICWISDYMKEKYPSDLPIIIANPETIKDELEKVLKNIDMLPEIGRKGRVFAENHHDMLKNSQKFIRIYKSLLN